MAGLLRQMGKEPEASVPAVRKPNTKLLWEKHVRQRRRSVKLLEGKVRKVLHKYRGKTLERLDTVHLGKDVSQKGLVDLIFSATEFGSALKLEVTEPIRATLAAAVGDLVEEVGADPWEMPPAKATEFLHSRTHPILGVGDTVRSQINTTLEEGVNAGESTVKLADRIKSVFNSMAGGEAERIARTEVNMAFNFARQDAMAGVGVEYKAWLSSHGPHVREAHMEAEQDYIDDPIPVTEPFVVDGEQLMFPGDDSGSPGNIINCQCVSIAAEKDDEKGWRFFGL
jgi:hypothetical protein